MKIKADAQVVLSLTLREACQALIMATAHNKNVSVKKYAIVTLEAKLRRAIRLQVLGENI